MLGFECQDVFVHRSKRSQTQPVGDLFVARAVAILFQEAREKIQEFLLAFGESHGLILGEQKGKSKDQKNRSATTILERVSARPAGSPASRARRTPSALFPSSASSLLAVALSV